MNKGTSNLAHKLIMIGTREGRGQVSDHFLETYEPSTRQLIINIPNWA